VFQKAKPETVFEWSKFLVFYNAKHVGGLESRHLISSFRRFIDSQTCSTQSFDKFWKNKLFLFDCKCFFRRSRQAPRCHKKFQVKYYSIILCLFVALFNECQKRFIIIGTLIMHYNIRHEWNHENVNQYFDKSF
jgi:hypothetical protein